jgi:hypothetical protein
MTSLEKKWLDLIEADRTKREAGLMVFLLALGKRALRRTRNALRLGVGWATALRDVFRGNESIDVPDPAGVLARGMADTHLAGYRRVGRIAGVELPALPDLSDAYKPAAQANLAAVADTLAGKVTDRLADAAAADAITADLRAASEAFEAAGYVETNPYGAERAASTAVLTAYGAGMGEAYGLAEVAERVRGLKFVATLDERTTGICRPRNNVRLPLGHPWLERHTPPLHWNCRSVLLPILGDFEPTEDPPWEPPPEDGFGQAPLYRGTVFA